MQHEGDNFVSSKCPQHSRPLCFLLLSDNNIAELLFNMLCNPSIALQVTSLYHFRQSLMWRSLSLSLLHSLGWPWTLHLPVLTPSTCSGWQMCTTTPSFECNFLKPIKFLCHRLMIYMISNYKTWTHEWPTWHGPHIAQKFREGGPSWLIWRSLMEVAGTGYRWSGKEEETVHRRNGGNKSRTTERAQELRKDERARRVAWGWEGRTRGFEDVRRAPWDCPGNGELWQP